jgi:Protein of unknown function (DUF2510)
MTATMEPGWYADPAGRFEHRYWDGARWTEHVGAKGVQSQDHLPPAMPTRPEPTTGPVEGATSTTDRVHTDEQSSGSLIYSRGPDSTPSPVPGPAAEAVKVTLFNARKLAAQFQADNHSLSVEIHRLQSLLHEYGVANVAERERKIAQQRQVESELEARLSELRAEIGELESAVIVDRDRLVLEEVGLFDFEHPAESSAALATELEALGDSADEQDRHGYHCHLKLHVQQLIR